MVLVLFAGFDGFGLWTAVLLGAFERG